MGDQQLLFELPDAAAQPPALGAPSNHHLPSLGVTVVRSLEAGDRVTLHFWYYQSEKELTVEPTTPGLSLDRLCLRIKRPADRVNFFIPWSDIFYVEAYGAEYSHYTNHRRLYNLPLKLARELLEASTGVEGRDEWSMRDSLRRALGKPYLFSRAAYTPFSWETKRRQEDTEIALRKVVDGGVVSAETAAPLTAGDIVVFTGAFLRNTGQQVGNAGFERWEVVPCDCGLCGLGRHVRAVLGSQDRHICRVHLRRFNQPSIAEVEPMVEWLICRGGQAIGQLTDGSKPAKKRRRKS